MVTPPFLDGLLPEGEPRKAIARDLGLRPDDTYGLIEALVEDLRSAPLGAGGRVRVSLTGVQEKLLLTRMPDGSWGRPVDGIHQEDFCQATGTPPDTKYEEDGGPSLRRVAGILGSVAAPEALERLARALTLNVVLGNGDAHAKNLSLLHHPSGALSLSPLYDLMCTRHYGDDRLAMYVDSVQRADRVTAEGIVNEAVRWGMSPSRATEVVGELLDRAPTALALAREETAGVPKDLVATIERRLAQLRA